MDERQPKKRTLRPGLELLSESLGEGPLVEPGNTYLIRLKMWLNKGDPVRWPSPWGAVDHSHLEDNGETLISDLRIDRHSLFNGLFHGVGGMRIGGVRRLLIAPHLAYGGRGVPEIIPANALLTVEVTILQERLFTAR